MNKYQVVRGDDKGEVWINDHLKKVGDIIQMTAEQAKYLLLNGTLDFHPLDHDKNGKPGGRRRAKAPAPAAQE